MRATASFQFLVSRPTIPFFHQSSIPAPHPLHLRHLRISTIRYFVSRAAVSASPCTAQLEDCFRSCVPWIRILSLMKTAKMEHNSAIIKNITFETIQPFDVGTAPPKTQNAVIVHNAPQSNIYTKCLIFRPFINATLKHTTASIKKVYESFHLQLPIFLYTNTFPKRSRNVSRPKIQSCS